MTTGKIKADDFEDAFQVIAEEADAAAAKVPCSPALYREGLRAIIATLRAAINASEEIEGMPDDGDEDPED